MVTPQSQRHAKNILRRNSLICYVPIHQRMERSSYSFLRAIRATCYGFILSAVIVLLALPSDAQQRPSRYDQFDTRAAQLADEIRHYNANPPPEPPPPPPVVQWPAAGLPTLSDAARHEMDIFAFVLWNEAGKEGRQAIESVASVIFNRARQSGQSFLAIVSADEQFHGYAPNPPDSFIHPNVDVLQYSGELQAWRDCYAYAECLVRGKFMYVISDHILNSDHFYSGPAPGWSTNLTNIHQIGNLTFGRMQRQR